MFIKAPCHLQEIKKLKPKMNKKSRKQFPFNKLI